jgi:hypothetical protein
VKRFYFELSCFNFIGNICIETFKENIENALSKSNGNIDYKDLKRFFECVKTDADLDVFLKGMIRYQSIQTDLDSRLSKPLMQYLYVSNRTDKALKLFMSKVGLVCHICAHNNLFFFFIAAVLFFTKENKFFHSESVAILLMNKLYEEKRFDDMIQVYNQYHSYGPRNLKFTLVELLLDALVEQVCFFHSAF